MPELPEVRTVVKYLNETVKGMKIKEVRVFYTGLLKNTNVNEFKKILIGQKINNVFPRGKYIIFELDNNEMISHLRMEGKWVFENKETFIYGEKTLEAQIEFENVSKVLRYYDSRRFGTIDITDKNQWMNFKGIAKLGPEPFDDEINVNYLYEKFQKTSRPIKTVILDQTVILGIGNIYADEILYAAKIHPLTPANHLSENDAKNILEESKKILSKAIEMGGTTIRSFKSGDNHVGNYQDFLKVHGKPEKNKKNPSSTIEKIKVGGRGTYYDFNVQKIK